jgi:hypothetical protein
LGLDSLVVVAYKKTGLCVGADWFASSGAHILGFGEVVFFAQYLTVRLVPELASIFSFDDMVDMDGVGEGHVGATVGDGATFPIS